MKALFNLIMLVLLSLSSNAQTNQYFTDVNYSIDFLTDWESANLTTKENIRLIPSDKPLLSQKLTIPLQEAEPFITAALQYDGPSNEQLLDQFAIRFSENGQNWADWVPVHDDMHIPDESRQSTFTGQLIFVKATSKYFQIAIYPKINQTIEINKIQVVFSAPGLTNHPTPTLKPQVNSRSVCPQPSVQWRDDWCSLGECPYGSSQSSTTVTHLIVHHSAGSNVSSDWPAVVRSIWHYHVDTRGWDDIGYNWLIDANGVLYEGRKDNIRGAHFSGHNSGTMGVCVLGNFHNASPKVAPKPAAVETLERLLCWKAEKENLNPKGTKYHSSSGLTLKVISGHRDGGSTSCPGDSLYIQLPAIRIFVDSLLHPVSIFETPKNSGLVSISPTLAQNSIQLKYTSAYHPKLKYQIISPSGKLIQQADLQDNKAIDILNFPEGIFFIRVIGKEILDVFRVVKI